MTITAFQIELQMAHRVVALAVFVLVAACALAGVAAAGRKGCADEDWPVGLVGA